MRAYLRDVLNRGFMVVYFCLQGDGFEQKVIRKDPYMLGLSLSLIGEN